MLGFPEVTPQQATEIASHFTAGSASPAVYLSAVMVVLARVLGFFVVVPFFGSMNIPMPARVGFGVILTATIAPSVASYATPGVLEAGGGIGFLLLLVNQALIGVLLGLVAALTFYGIESAGRVIDTQRGSNITDIIAPQTGERTSPTGQWLMMLALVILLISDAHLLLLQGIIDSFRVFPATTSLDWITGDNGDRVVKDLADLSGNMLVIMIKVAAPAMISLLLADCLLGIINRGAPQVNVFALSQVIKGPIGLGALFVSIPALVMYLAGSNFDLPNHSAFHDLLGPKGHIAQVVRDMAGK